LQSTALKSSSHIGFATLLLMTFSFFSGGCGHTVHKDIKPIVQRAHLIHNQTKKAAPQKKNTGGKPLKIPYLMA
jgi:hypothetical protein